MAPAPTLEVLRKDIVGLTHFTLSGVIDDSLAVDIFGTVTQPMLIDLEKISRITSYGVRQWTRALASSTSPYIGFVNAHPCMMVQFNSVSGFAGTGQLLSLYSPFICKACGKPFEILHDLRKEQATISQSNEPTAQCPDCRGEGEFDDLPDSYYFYLSTAAPPRPPQVVQAYLAGKASDEVQAFRVEKDIDLEGDVTALWFRGFLDRPSRLKRVADGLEGHVLLLGLGLTGASKEGLNALIDLLTNIEIDVWLARFPDPIVDQIKQRLGSNGHVHFVEPATQPPGPIHSYLTDHSQVPTGRGSTPSQSSAIGKYRVLRRVGAGGMAEVFLAQLDGPGGFQKKVVIKRILPHLVRDSAFVSMFLQEAKVAARITHPNVVQIYEVGHDKSEFFIAMEYVRGFDLNALLQASIQHSKVVPIHIALRIAAGICGGLNAAHSWRDDSGKVAPIIHRDISPHNILVSLDGQIKVTDFGIARASDQQSNTPTVTIKGKLAYTAPELLRSTDKQTLTPQCDIFSVGVILFQLLTLVQPFRRETEMQTLYALLQQPMPMVETYRPDAPQEVSRVVAKALEREPGARYLTAKDMANDLELACAHIERRDGPGESIETWSAGLVQVSATPGGIRLQTNITPSQGPAPADDVDHRTPTH